MHTYMHMCTILYTLPLSTKGVACETSMNETASDTIGTKVQENSNNNMQ